MLRLNAGQMEVNTVLISLAKLKLSNRRPQKAAMKGIYKIYKMSASWVAVDPLDPSSHVRAFG